MPFTTQFLPYAIGAEALVLPPATYGTETWLIGGFGPGIADPASCNTIWRQTTFVSSGITQWMANTLKININDDGNLTNFVTLFGSAIVNGVAGGVTSFNTRKGAVVINSTDITNALGYTPVRTFNGRGGAVVLNATDVNNALGYVPVNKGGDTMLGLLSGPNPTAPSHYATKQYVDNSISSGPGGTTGITGNISEYTFPLGNGGYLKVGQYIPSTGVWAGSANGVLLGFATPFPSACAKVDANLIYATGSTGTSWGIALDPGGSNNISAALNKNGFALTITGSWVGTSGPFPFGIIWTAIGY